MPAAPFERQPAEQRQQRNHQRQLHRQHVEQRGVDQRQQYRARAEAAGPAGRMQVGRQLDLRDLRRVQRQPDPEQHPDQHPGGELLPPAFPGGKGGGEQQERQRQFAQGQRGGDDHHRHPPLCAVPQRQPQREGQQQAGPGLAHGGEAGGNRCQPGGRDQPGGGQLFEPHHRGRQREQPEQNDRPVKGLLGAVEPGPAELGAGQIKRRLADRHEWAGRVVVRPLQLGHRTIIVFAALHFLHDVAKQHHVGVVPGGGLGDLAGRSRQAPCGSDEEHHGDEDGIRAGELREHPPCSLQPERSGKLPRRCYPRIRPGMRVPPGGFDHHHPRALRAAHQARPRRADWKSWSGQRVRFAVAIYNYAY